MSTKFFDFKIVVTGPLGHVMNRMSENEHFSKTRLIAPKRVGIVWCIDTIFRQNFGLFFQCRVFNVNPFHAARASPNNVVGAPRAVINN